MDENLIKFAGNLLRNVTGYIKSSIINENL